MLFSILVITWYLLPTFLCIHLHNRLDFERFSMERGWSIEEVKMAMRAYFIPFLNILLMVGLLKLLIESNDD